MYKKKRPPLFVRLAKEQPVERWFEEKFVKTNFMALPRGVTYYPQSDAVKEILKSLKV